MSNDKDDKSPYGAGLAKFSAKAIEDAGGTVVVNEGIEPTTDYTAIIDTVMAEDHDVLYYSGYESEAPLVLKQYRDKGGEGLFMATLTGPGKVWLQSLPFSRLAGRVLANAGGRGKSADEGSVLNTLGGLGNVLMGGRD